MVKTPLLSVVIPTWNRSSLVCDAIDSALQQRDGAVEVIVVDDASSDATVDLLKREFGLRIRLLQLDQRRGPGGARNAGAHVARGEFVAFLDSDDVWLAGKLDAELRVFARYPDADVVVSDSQNFFENVADSSSRFAQNGLLAATAGEVRLAQNCEWLWTNSMNTVHTCAITVRRSALLRMGERLFAEDLECCEDWEFQMRLHHNCRVVVLPRIFSHVRRYNDNSRAGRSIPGRAATWEQEQVLLRSRLTVMERADWLTGLPAQLHAELRRFREDTESKLSCSRGAAAAQRGA